MVLFLTQWNSACDVFAEILDAFHHRGGHILKCVVLNIDLAQERQLYSDLPKLAFSLQLSFI